jgi:hypothetical protein
MISEDYVSLETAKLLKGKGFNEPCYMSYHETHKGFEIGDDAGHTNDMFDKFFKDDGVMQYSAPTLQTAMKWIRNVHNIHIIVRPYTDTEGHKFNFLFDKFAYGCWQELGIYIMDYWGTYEECADKAIIYALKNLI